uniref:AlNc14C48G3853 protein n=1 Tax=Albugo laibachii Nc14 TaxID=890382 RepID=F0WAZ3_9STRA|nr:AlNc14C48G3853 [Albugo laibachii Nc14]CCA18412.1 AlNc14C50G3937 [Albugo laibachii Nc14]|eukprot:CCA18412.1 AlNc14C50G3937 [Albugo laibachii Nc14]
MQNHKCKLQPTDSVYTLPLGSHLSQNNYKPLHYINSANTTYGAIPLPQTTCDKQWNKCDCLPEEGNPEDPVSNNQDPGSTLVEANAQDRRREDTTCSSILRVKLGQVACSQPLKFCSVIFQLENQKAPPEREGNIASRCMPRRLTPQEKAELYNSRPDLNTSSDFFPIISSSSWEGDLRKRHRNTMFACLVSMLSIFVCVVLYYIFNQI